MQTLRDASDDGCETVIYRRNWYRTRHQTLPPRRPICPSQQFHKLIGGNANRHFGLNSGNKKEFTFSKPLCLLIKNGALPRLIFAHLDESQVAGLLIFQFLRFAFPRRDSALKNDPTWMLLTMGSGFERWRNVDSWVNESYVNSTRNSSEIT